MQKIKVAEEYNSIELSVGKTEGSTATSNIMRARAHTLRRHHAIDTSGCCLDDGRSNQHLTRLPHKKHRLLKGQVPPQCVASKVPFNKYLKTHWRLRLWKSVPTIFTGLNSTLNELLEANQSNATQNKLQEREME